MNNPVAPDTDFTATVSNNLAGAQIVYDYEDSLTGGASYNWTEIDPNDSGRDYDGIRLDNVSSFFDTPQSVSVSFSFPFYGNNYSQIHVSPHGMIALGSQTAAYENTGIPSTAAPDLFIAPFWYDQNQQQAGDVYFYELNDRIIIQYEQVVSTNGDGTYTYQAVLHSSGLIEFFYKEMVGNLESATVGLENSDGTEGLEIAHNEPYVQNGLAVRISQGPAYFVKVFPLNGTTTAGHNTPLNVRFNAFDLTPGTYTADIDIAHDGTGDTPWSVPAILKITNPPSQIELTAPEDGFTMWANESVTLRATATDDDFGVERVEFFADEAKQGESLTGNDYSFNWEPPAPGVYSVTARAVDRLDAVTISEPITVTVLADTDLDRMEDGWEVDNGLDPLDPTDALEDPDGDRIPNLWEYRHQSDPSVAGSVPNPSLTVAIDGSGDHTNLQAAYNAAEDFDIIFAKSGHYEGRLNATSSKRLLWLGELDAATPPVTLENTTSSDTLRLFADTVMDGFAFTCAGSSNERAIYATTVWNQAQSSRIRLINCSIRDHASSSGAVLYNDDADVALIHCTIYRNHSSYSDALLYNRNGTVKTTVRNSIVWNPVQSAPELRAGSYDYEVIDSIVRNGDFDGIDSDPLLTRAGWLTGDSPARGTANATGSAIDIHDEARPTSVNADLGWDQFIDSDTDDLPDWWELHHFGDLTSQDAAADADGDGLSNLQEYELDGDPMDPEGDIDGD
ncbi:MAG: hypothetical protein GVY36_09025, partial [Verrucomicrobia bacterium]|nr:hypothetical protein [Verrucomicrobiota bacterium]